MSKLEPTRTYSNPTATEVLRRMLDERGGFRVDFDREGARRTCWKIDDEQDGYCYFDEDVFGATQLTVTRVTPEQAIAATLGPAARHPKPHEQWTTVLLPEIAWSWDDIWPDYLSVAHDANGEWRVYVPEDTLGTGTCRITDNGPWGYPYVCSECGASFDPDVNGGDFNYCPNCGRRVEQ